MWPCSQLFFYPYSVLRTADLAVLQFFKATVNWPNAPIWHLVFLHWKWFIFVPRKLAKRRKTTSVTTQTTAERKLRNRSVSPTVSTSTTSYPAPSQRTMASLVVLVTPPSVPEAGDGLMNAFMSLESSVIRVLSPNRDPAARERESSQLGAWS